MDGRFVRVSMSVSAGRKNMGSAVYFAIKMFNYMRSLFDRWEQYQNEELVGQKRYLPSSFGKKERFCVVTSSFPSERRLVVIGMQEHMLQQPRCTRFPFCQKPRTHSTRYSTTHIASRAKEEEVYETLCSMVKKRDFLTSPYSIPRTESHNNRERESNPRPPVLQDFRDTHARLE